MISIKSRLLETKSLSYLPWIKTGEMLVGPVNALFMDNISTGLDSSTTYQIVNSIRQSIHIFSKSALISLLQPPPETFELFDDVILLAEGQIVYQGPREYILEFFEFMGFKCPERKGVADYLQEVSENFVSLTLPCNHYLLLIHTIVLVNSNVIHFMQMFMLNCFQHFTICLPFSLSSLENIFIGHFKKGSETVLD